MFLNHFQQLLHSLGEDGSWDCHIQAHEAFAAGIEGLAVVQGEACLSEFILECICLERPRATAVDHLVEIVFHILNHFSSGLSMGIILSADRFLHENSHFYGETMTI